MESKRLEALRRRIRAHGNHSQLAAATRGRVSRPTIVAICNGTTPNPGVLTIEALELALAKLEGTTNTTHRGSVK